MFYGIVPVLCFGPVSLIRFAGGRFNRLAQFDVQITQLRLVHHARCFGEQARSLLGFGEGNHIADRLGAGHERADTVDTEGDATVRRRAELVFRGVGSSRFGNRLRPGLFLWFHLPCQACGHPAEHEHAGAERGPQ